MKTTRQRLLNIVITMSVAINVVMLGGLGYIAAVDNKADRVHAAMSLPVLVYIPQSVASSDTTTLSKAPVKQ